MGRCLADDEPNALERVQQKGVIEVAVYQGLPPYSFREKGRIVGVDADVARALAEQLGVAASIRAVGADENMEDDLATTFGRGTIWAAALPMSCSTCHSIRNSPKKTIVLCF